MLTIGRLGSVAGPADGDSTLDGFNTLRDPTVLSSHMGLGYDYADQDQGAFRNKMTLSGAYAFGPAGRQDWVFSAELPFIHDEPGNSSGDRATGVGDFKLGFGHVLDGTGRFRWGLGLAGTFDTASKAQFGDGALTISPIWGGGFRFTPDFELVGNVQYNASVYEAAGRLHVHSLDLSPALLKTWSHHWYSLLGWESGIDFENNNTHTGKVKVEIGKAFGPRQQWVFSTGVDVPLVRPGQDNFTLKVGLNHVF